MFQTKCVDKFKTLILGSITFFENRAVHELMSKNNVQSAGHLITIWHMRIVCWPQATNTHSEYAVVTAFPLQQ